MKKLFFIIFNSHLLRYSHFCDPKGSSIFDRGLYFKPGSSVLPGLF